MLLENDQLRVEVDELHGAIVGLEHKQSGWEFLQQPLLSQPIRLMVPVKGHRNNRAEGREQTLAAVDRKGPAEFHLRWDSFTFPRCGRLPIEVHLLLRLDGNCLQLDLEISNHSEHMIEEVWMPVLGGVKAPGNEPPLNSLTMHLCGGFSRTPLGDGFPAEAGYWGTDYPTFLRFYPGPGMETPLTLLENGKRGLYIGDHSGQNELLIFAHELKPGYLDSKHRRVPSSNEVSGHPAGVVFSAVKLPFIQPGESKAIGPLVIRPYAGGWHEGLRPFMDYHSKSRLQIPKPDWLSGVQSWLTIHLNSPEGCVRYRYSELPSVAREAKEAGVGALQIIGWAIGGQDGFEPYQDTDPLLGTQKEFAAAIKEIQRMGIRVLLMCKFKWADANTPAYEKEFRQHALRDMHGRETYFDGYGYQTMAQFLAGGSRKTGAGLCHLSEGLRKLALREFRKILDLNPDGILYDELSNHMLLCFDTSHGHSYGACIAPGSLGLAREFHAEAQKHNPNLLLCGEGPSDHLSDFYHVNYIRTWDGTGEQEHTPAWKYMAPEMQFAACVTGFDDREMLNQCIVYGYIICYEPFHFKGRPRDFPQTIEYGRKLQVFRQKLSDFIWEGIFLHTTGAQITAKSESNFLYSVFERRADQKRAIVLANQGEDELRAEARLTNARSSNLAVHDPESPDVQRTEGRVTVASRSLVVLIEE